MKKVWLIVLFNTGKKRTRLRILKKLDKSERKAWMNSSLLVPKILQFPK